MLGIYKCYFRKTTVVFCVVLLLACTVGFCSGTTISVGNDRDVGVAQERLRTKITYSCVDKPIEDVLDDLAREAKLSIVRSRQVTGPLTLQVVDVPLEEVLSNILAANGFTYVATPSMIRVVPLSEAAVLREEVVTEVYQITYADVAEVAAALQNFVSSQGRIAFNKGTSHIVITDTSDRVKAVGKFIEQLDRETKQVLVEVRIYDIITNDAFEIKPNWDIERNADTVTTDYSGSSKRSASSGAKSEASTDIDSSTNIPLDYVYATPVYSNTDTSTRNDTWLSSSIEDSRTTTKEWERERRKPVFGGSFSRKKGGTISISLLNNAIDLDFVLTMLHSLEEAKLLANPRVMVLDNETALFETVREIPYTERITTADTAGTITSTVFKPVGVKLHVTPHIARDGMIRLKIEPEFGVVVELNDDGAPTIDTRRAVTTNIIKDGQTIVLGGLRKSEMRREVDKVPLLGDLPVLGFLFRAESESEITTELVVFITTTIIDSPSLSKAEQAQLDTTSRMIYEVSRPKSDTSKTGKQKKEAVRPEKVTHEYIDEWIKAKAKKSSGR